MRNRPFGSMLAICLAVAGGCSSGQPPAAPDQAASGIREETRKEASAEPASNPTAPAASPSAQPQQTEAAPVLLADVSERTPMSFVPQDAIAALVIHPKRTAVSEVGQPFLKLDAVQDALRRSHVNPGDIERIVYAMGVPTDESENDCTIVRYASPRPRASLLAQEFRDLAYEEVQFQGTTYYRFALGPAVDDDVRSLDTNGVTHEATADEESRVLARYPDDLRPNDNGHADVSDSGNWFYQASETQNPTAPEANLRQLNWDAERQRFQSPKQGDNNVFPAIGESLHPSPDPPCFAVLRWQSRVPAEIRIRGNFSKLADAKDSNGVHVMVFVDGQQEFADDVGPRDARGIDFDVRTSVRRGSVVDFVVDPKVDAYWDATKLTATIEQSPPDAAVSRPLVQPPVAESAAEPTTTVSAIFFVDDTTMVSTDEQRLRTLIAGPPRETPLTEKLSRLDLDHDLVGVVVLEGRQDQAAKLLDLAMGELGLGETVGLAAMPSHTRSAVATLDLTGDLLLRLTLEAAAAQSATSLNDGAKSLVGVLRGLRDALPQEMPDAAANPLLPLLDDFIGNVTVRQDGLNVNVDARTTKGLAEFVRNDAANVISSMRPRRAQQRPAVSAMREFDPPKDMSDKQSPVMDDKTAGGPSADAGTTSQPTTATTIIEPTQDHWDVGAGNARAAEKELVIDAEGGPYWLISRKAIPANFRLQIEGRIEFLQGGQVLQNTQESILRALCVRFGTADQKADILAAKGYHIRHTHTRLLLSKDSQVIASGEVGNGQRPVSAIPTASGLRVTSPAPEPWPFTMAVTKKDDAISVEFNGTKVVDHSDRFFLSSSDKLAIGGYTSRLYLGRVSVTDLGPPKSPPDMSSSAVEIVDRDGELGRFQPLLLQHPVDRMVLSEDARYLAASHREANSISVIDVQSLDLVARIDTPAPRALLWRGDHLFAANEGLGTISMFSASGQWKTVRSIPVGDPNPEFMSAPGGRNFRGVIAVRCRGNGRDALPVVIVNVKSGRESMFQNGRTSAANVDYGGKVMIVQSRPGSPNRYITGIYNFAAVSQGRATPSTGEQIDSFPLLYQVGATSYWFGGRQVFTGMPMKAMIEAERLLVADRVIDVCYAFKADEIRCIGLGRTLEDLGSRPLDLPDRIQDVTDIGDLHVAATLGEKLHVFLLDSERTVHTVDLPAFEVPAGYAKTDRAVAVARPREPAREESERAEAAAGGPIKRTWTDSSGRFHIEAELVEVKDGQVTLKKADGSTITLPLDKLSEADRRFVAGPADGIRE